MGRMLLFSKRNNILIGGDGWQSEEFSVCNWLGSVPAHA